MDRLEELRRAYHAAGATLRAAREAGDPRAIRVAKARVALAFDAFNTEQRRLSGGPDQRRKEPVNNQQSAAAEFIELLAMVFEEGAGKLSEAMMEALASDWLTTRKRTREIIERYNPADILAAAKTLGAEGARRPPVIEGKVTHTPAPEPPKALHNGHANGTATLQLEEHRSFGTVVRKPRGAQRRKREVTLADEDRYVTVGPYMIERAGKRILIPRHRRKARMTNPAPH